MKRAARRDVYGELLARGQVGRVLEDPEARKQLRSELRRQARADKLRIITREYDDVVIALLKRPMTPELKDEARNAIRGAYAPHRLRGARGDRACRRRHAIGTPGRAAIDG